MGRAIAFAGAVIPGVSGGWFRGGAKGAKNGTRVFRVWGDGAGPNGRSWTNIDPGTVPNYRDVAGLPVENTGRFVSEGVLVDATGVTTRSALPLGNNRGGYFPKSEYEVGSIGV